MKSVSAETLNVWLQKKEVILIDVREPIEYEVEHIEGSILIPLSLIIKEKIPIKEDKKIVIYCKGGTRGASACRQVNGMNLGSEVYNLEGGITAWKEKFKTIKGSRNVLPLDRQMQIIVGSCVLIFTILGAFVNQNFLFVSAFFGGGLLFAGLTGFCALIKILSFLPWNKSTMKSGSCSI